MAFLFQMPSASINPKLQLMNYSISEVPALPGHVLNLTLAIRSMEPDNCAQRVAMQISTSYPFSVEGPDTQYKEGELCYRDPESAGTFSFLIPVDNLAQSGTYQVSVLTTYEKRYSKFSESNTINIRVGGSPSFIASVQSSSPTDIYAGDDAQVTIKFQNTGSTVVKSARASATSSGIKVKWAGKSQAIGQVSAYGSATATFGIEAAKDLAPGDYPLNVVLEYLGEDSQNGTTTFHFIVPVKERAEFAVSGQSGQVLNSGVQEDAIITVANSGTEEARKIKVRIKPLFPFSTDGTVRYIESLKPGESQNLTYAVTVDKDATAGAQMLSLVFDFENPKGEKFSDTADFALDVRVRPLYDELMQYWYVFAIAFVLAMAYVVKNMAKKK